MTEEGTVEAGGDGAAGTVAWGAAVAEGGTCTVDDGAVDVAEGEVAAGTGLAEVTGDLA